MIGFDLSPPVPDRAAEAANGLMYGCRRRGVHLTYGYGYVNFRIIPPLVISRSEIDFAVEAIAGSLHEIVARTGAHKEDWPQNPYTRRLLEQHPVGRWLNRWWRSSPEKWVEKGSEIFRKQFGVSK